MTRPQPTPEETEAENLAIWLCRNPEAAVALDRWLNPDKRAQARPESEAGPEAEQ